MAKRPSAVRSGTIDRHALPHGFVADRVFARNAASGEADDGLLPLPVGVDDGDRGHLHAEHQLHQLDDALERRFFGGIQNLVAAQRRQPAFFVLEPVMPCHGHTCGRLAAMMPTIG